jgi:hypothetical protein
MTLNGQNILRQDVSWLNSRASYDLSTERGTIMLDKGGQLSKANKKRQAVKIPGTKV